MSKTKIIIIGVLFAVIAALLQLIPILRSEVFVFLNICSAVPIYIISRINPKVGLLSYFVASMFAMILNIQEGLFFLCTNGVIGISLGICSYYTETKVITWLSSSIMLTTTLSIMNYGIGTPVFGGKIPGGIIIQIVIIFLFSIIYNILYYYFFSFIFNFFRKFNVYK